MSRKLLQFHKTIIEDSCILLSQQKFTVKECIERIVLSFEDPEEKCKRLIEQINDETVCTVVKQVIQYILQFKKENKIGTPIKKNVMNVLQACFSHINKTTNDDIHKKMVDYSFWSEYVLWPILSLQDNKWFLESIQELVEQKYFFVINHHHLEVAKQNCSRDTYYIIKSYYDVKCNVEPFESLVKNKDITDEQLIQYFKNGMYLWKIDYWLSVCFQKRRILFEFAVKSGYPFRNELSTEDFSYLYFITGVGLDCIQYVKENYPRELSGDEFYSAICSVCCNDNKKDDIDCLRYLVEVCKVKINYWAATQGCLMYNKINCFEYCVSIGVPIKYSYCIDIINENPSLLESSEIINEIFGQSKESTNVVKNRCSVICESLYSLTFGEYNETLKKEYPDENVRLALWYILHMNGKKEYKDDLLQLCKEDPCIKNNTDITSYLALIGNYYSLKFVIENKFKVKARDLCTFLKYSLNMFPLASSYKYNKELEEFINSL